MLNNETKRRIDTARDILVGKIPDPKSQVEQITLALIYKFMDDMDSEAEDLGGEPSFFSGEYERYGWRKIFNPSLGGFEMLTLYSEAITKLSHNPNLPQLFRDIFKNAYLPYRDPETLKSFLKIINDFNYDHSEKLGDAFEYLLSVLGSQGDAGQFRTPRHIIDFMTALIAPKKNETILDPACGTAGFLISAYKHILKVNSSNHNESDPHTFEQNNVNLAEITINGLHYLGDKLTPEERGKLVNNIRGYDISPDMVRLSLVNLYLHGFAEPHIYEYDTLSSDDRWNEYYDVILANPPFMTPKGGIRPHKRFSIQSKRSEVLFVDYMVEHLTPNGRAAIIVPEGIIFQNGSAYKTLRKALVDNNFLIGVISLPAGVFNPYSGVRTSILWLDRTLARKTDKILFVKIENDGYDLGAQRKPIKQNDLPNVFNDLRKYHQSLLSGIEPDLEVSQFIFPVNKTQISRNSDYNLSGERYRKLSIESSKLRLVELEDIFEIQRGGSPRPINEYFTDDKNGINWIKISDVKEGEKFVNFTKQKIKPEGLKKSRLVEPGDFILSNSMSFGRPYIVNIIGAIHDGWLVLKQKNNNLIKEFVLYILNSAPAQEQFYQVATGGVVKNLNINLVKKVKIPLPPLSVQEELVAKIESYQKIIDGAKLIIENYRPRFEIDPSWEIVELGNICQINPKKSELKDVDKSFNVSFVPMADLNENQMYFLSEQTRKLEEVYSGYTYFREDDVIFAKVTPCFENGKAGIARDLLNNIGFGSSEYYVIRPNEKILSPWIYLNITSDIFRKEGKLKMTGTGGLQRVPKGYLSSYRIPLPPLSIQKQIIKAIEIEQETVKMNQNLVLIFEQKIKDIIKQVWNI